MKQTEPESQAAIVSTKSSVTVYGLSGEKKQALVERANLGDAEAAFRLALSWEMGDRSISQAAYWYYRAAVAGLVKAQYSLAIIYYTEPRLGSGEQAYIWMSRAAASGDIDAKKWLRVHKQRP